MLWKVNLLTQEKINRINQLAKKSKEVGLTEQEKKEQSILRQEYIKDIKRNLSNTLENLVIVNEEGQEKKLNKKF